MHVDQYEVISDSYEDAKDLPYARFPERHSMLRAIGDVRGKSVLDLACGTGFYSRGLRDAGARRVVGVDASEAMLSVARAWEAHLPTGIEYLAHDVAALPRLGEFDLVTAAYLFNYAPDVAALGRMCGRIAENLRGGGEFVCLGPDPDIAPRPAVETRGYGYAIEELGRADRGRRLRVTLLTDPPIVLENRTFDREVHEEALARAGFTDVEWVPPTIGPEGAAAFGDGFWDAFLAHPPLVVLRARR